MELVPLHSQGQASRKRGMGDKLLGKTFIIDVYNFNPTSTPLSTTPSGGNRGPLVAAGGSVMRLTVLFPKRLS